ncbi:MAG: transposase family protein [Planctomycetia bacterium]|nr:transposase family protein [Planctomycetia bacterium]
MTASTAPVIFSHFEDLTDPRMDRTKLHLLVDMIVIALCAAICGAEGWADSCSMHGPATSRSAWGRWPLLRTPMRSRRCHSS